MKSNKPIKLASYNIRKCVGLDRRRQPERTIDVINDIGADVLALQEADRRLGDRPAALPARLIEDETDFRIVTQTGDGSSLGWHGNAILVRKEIATADVDFLTLPGTEPRGAVAITLDGKFRIVATHLGLRRRDRRKQTDLIARHLGQWEVPGTVLGDLNEWSQNRGLEPLGRDFTLHSPGHSFHAARPMAALDRFAFSNAVQMSDAGVMETTKARIASDHLPIWADINLPEPAPVD